MARNQVLVVTPPNSNTVLPGQLATVTRPEEHSDWSDFMSLGLLSLVSAIERNPRVLPIYVDGTIIPFDDILDYVSEHASSILAVCISVLTANYEAGRMLLQHAKEHDERIVTIIGNDHFTAMPERCMARSKCIDFGFVGNEVVGSFARAIFELAEGEPISTSHPGLVYRHHDGTIVTAPQRQEAVFSDYDYTLVDRVFQHSGTYTEQFKKRVADRVKELTGREVSAGIPLELGRGCVKFASDDACSFCSIQYGGMWKNQLSAKRAWEAIRHAQESGYDYLYITADELPLTFAPLLQAMQRSKPAWWESLGEAERPLMVGYARADGIADARRTRLLTSLGIRQVMIGMDAGAARSLSAMNKPLGGGRPDWEARAEKLFEDNWNAIRVAREEGMLIRAGFVLGHLGMTPELLRENVEKMKALIDAGHDVFSAIDIEVLQPTPGSLDWTYLTSPADAAQASDRLGLPINMDALKRVAAAWAEEDTVLPEVAMRDYTEALMPGVSFAEISSGRVAIRQHAKLHGIVVGE